MRKSHSAAVGSLLITAALLGASAAGRASTVPTIQRTLTGTVTDRDGAALSGISVKLFVAGLLTTTTATGADGGYAIDLTFDPDSDETVVVWWLAPRTDLVSELAILHESRRDRQLGLWGPCIPRIGDRTQGPWTVRIADRASLREDLRRSCAREGRQVRPGQTDGTIKRSGVEEVG